MYKFQTVASGCCSLLTVAALWSCILHATSQVASPASTSLRVPPSGSADWLVPSQSKPLSRVDAVCSLRSRMLGRCRGFALPFCSRRNFRARRNCCENFSQEDCTLFFRSRNSLCLDSLSVVFLGPTKTDLFCLTWWSAAETQCCSRTRRGEGHGGGKESVWYFFFPYCRKLLTVEQLLCFLLNSRTRQIGGYVCVPQTQVICSERRSWGWTMIEKKGVLKRLEVTLSISLEHFSFKFSRLMMELNILWPISYLLIRSLFFITRLWWRSLTLHLNTLFNPQPQPLTEIYLVLLFASMEINSPGRVVRERHQNLLWHHIFF